MFTGVTSLGKTGSGQGIRKTGINFSGKTAVFMGDSITHGVGASMVQNRWTSLFCTGRGATESNLGQDGMTMQSPHPCALPVFDIANIPTYNSGTHCALFIALGINDVGNEHNAGGTLNMSHFQTQYSAALTSITTTKGWPSSKVILINIYHPYSWNVYTSGGCTSVAVTDSDAVSYNSVIQSLATTFGVWYEDIYSKMVNLDSSYYQDQLHPVDKGHALIANWFIAEL